MNMLKRPNACTIGNTERPEMKRETAVVAVVVSIAPAARLYVQEKRVRSVPEMGWGMLALSIQVSVKTKMSSAPTQRIRKMPMSSSAATWFWPMTIHRNMARKIEMMISKRPARVSRNEPVFRMMMRATTMMENITNVMSARAKALVIVSTWPVHNPDHQMLTGLPPVETLLSNTFVALNSSLVSSSNSTRSSTNFSSKSTKPRPSSVSLSLYGEYTW
mmetsp:Transcript_17844/g.36265  ORF Transcript_17844/g.36265 Transcript_17844/m.36265 type:complete len:218 (-) Transcript_17844:917-1570(-)